MKPYTIVGRGNNQEDLARNWRNGRGWPKSSRRAEKKSYRKELNDEARKDAKEGTDQ